MLGSNLSQLENRAVLNQSTFTCQTSKTKLRLLRRISDDILFPTCLQLRRLCRHLLKQITWAHTFYSKDKIQLEFMKVRSSICIVLCVIVKFLQDKKKYCKRRAKISADISARLFRVMCKVSSILIHKD